MLHIRHCTILWSHCMPEYGFLLLGNTTLNILFFCRISSLADTPSYLLTASEQMSQSLNSVNTVADTSTAAKKLNSPCPPLFSTLRNKEAVKQ